MADRKPAEQLCEERPAESSLECAICLSTMAEALACRLPCGHLYHGACVEGLRTFGVRKACPLCRADLPAGAAKLFCEACRRYAVIERLIASGTVSWASLSRAHQKEMGEVVRTFCEAADQGHAGAQFNLGIMYFNGRGVVQNYTEALQWYRKAADQGHADAQLNLGVMYFEGKGVAQNHSEAARWCRKAADQGHAVAQCNLGAMCCEGQGVEKNYTEAMQLFRKAADQGHAGAQFMLGIMYERGHGVVTSAVEALKWYHKAAAQGHAKSIKAASVLEENN